MEALTYERITPKGWLFKVRLDWPSIITETTFLEAVNRLPTGKTYSFLSDETPSRNG